MLDIREIEYWISKYEQEADKLSQCVTLSALYSIRNEMLGQTSRPQAAAYSEASGPVVELPRYGDSDFLRAVAGAPENEAWLVMDELMDTLRVVNNRAYNGVMEKIRGL